MTTIKTTLASALLGLAISSTGALAAGGEVHHADHAFSFDGMFGTYDQGELQRGLQVYREVCQACHGMKFVAFRTLGDKYGPHLAEEQVKAIAAEYDVPDPEGEPGDTISGKPYDYFPDNTTAGAPDLSLMAKAREGGAVHIYSILTGYTGEEKEEAGSFLYENHAFPGGWIAMAPPLSEDNVEYADGSPASLEQMSNDVSAFLMWAAEPHMVERKQAGLRNVLFLAFFAVLLWFTNKKVWKKIKHPEADA